MVVCRPFCAVAVHYHFLPKACSAHCIPLPSSIDTLHLVSYRATLLEHIPVLPDAAGDDEIPEALSEC